MTSYRQIRASRGAGFTLVEILVVIAIIGMLAGLTTTVLVSARRSVRSSVVATQQAQLSMALDEYKNKYGEYPPDLSDEEAVLRHIKKRWPRYNVKSLDQFYKHIEFGCRLSSGNYPRNYNFQSNEDPVGEHVWVLGRYMSSLVFWLGGLPDADGVPSGFYSNPKSPLGIDANGTPIAKPGRATREKPLYAFERKDITPLAVDGTGNDSVFYPADEGSLRDDDRDPYVYTPAYCPGGYPIVYFRPSIRVPYEAKYIFWGETASEGITQAIPYARTWTDNGNGVVPLTWYEERRFQLIHPGVDGYFGTLENGGTRLGYPATEPKVNCGPEDDDNIVNFVQEGTLQSEYKDASGN